MNNEPHQHIVHIERRYNALDEGHWLVRYGTTSEVFAFSFSKPWLWSPEKQQRVIGKAIAKAIKSHDRGSQATEPRSWRSDIERAITDRMFPKSLPTNVWATTAMEEVPSGR